MRYRLFSTLIILLILIIIGTVVYKHLENWSWIDSLYFTTATLTTVGYGDLYPTNDATKLFTVGFILVGVSFVLFSITTIGHAYLKYTHKLENRVKDVTIKIERNRRPWKVKKHKEEKSEWHRV